MEDYRLNTWPENRHSLHKQGNPLKVTGCPHRAVSKDFSRKLNTKKICQIAQGTLTRTALRGFRNEAHLEIWKKFKRNWLMLELELSEPPCTNDYRTWAFNCFLPLWKQERQRHYCIFQTSFYGVRVTAVLKCILKKKNWTSNDL